MLSGSKLNQNQNLIIKQNRVQQSAENRRKECH